MHKVETRAPVFMVGMVLAVLVLASPAGAEPVGFVAGLEGTVEIQRGAASSWTAAELDQSVEIGDSVRTGPDSAVKIVLADDTTLSLGGETELVIDSLVVGEAATREPSILRQLKGQIRTRVGEAFGGPTRLEMHTPTAVIGVKGTVFESRIDLWGGELATLACNFEGNVFARFLADQTDWDVPLGLCRRAFADRITAPIEPPPDFVPVSSPSEGAGTQITQQILFGPDAEGEGQGVDEWLAASTLPAVSGGPEGVEGVADSGGAVEGETVFEDREDVFAVQSDSLSGDFPIGGGETPTQPGPPTDIPIGGGETPPQN